jgi:hypothetical protein
MSEVLKMDIKPILGFIALGIIAIAVIYTAWESYQINRKKNAKR